MKKFLASIVLCLILVISLGWVFQAKIASRLLSQASGIDIRIESLSISPGGLQASHVFAHEPKSVTTLSVGTLEVEANMFQLFNDVVIVNSLKLDDVKMKSDIGKIDIKALGKLFNGKKKDSPKTNVSGQKYVIELLEASNIHVLVENPLSDQPLVKANIPNLRLTNVNKGKPLNLKQVLDFVTGALEAR